MARLLLDAHVSGTRVAVALRERGHDVRAVDRESDLDAMSDANLLALASRDERILVTGNGKDFVPIIRQWADANRHHAGCILIPKTIRNEQFGAIIVGISAILDATPLQQDWEDRVQWLSRNRG